MSKEPIVLSSDQKRRIFQAVGRRVAAIVTNTPGVKPRSELGDLADKIVLGAFVSLKRQGQLRSCMGCLAETFPLVDALDNAAARAARDDPRFSPITPAELLELDMEVWVLWGIQQVHVSGKERAGAVEIGRHGIILERNGNRGLLLPGVALEFGMNAEAFLEACTNKANLPPGAWAEDSVRFSTFEGLAIGGPLSEVEIRDPAARAAIGRSGPRATMIQKPGGPSITDIKKLCEMCQSNFFLCLERMAPSYVRPDAFDGNVAGIAISVQFPDRPLMVCSKIGIKNDVPLQSSLTELVTVLTQQVLRFGATHQERLDAQFDLTVFWDPVIQGTAENHDLSHVDPMRRSLMVASKSGWVLQYNPEVPMPAILKESLEFLQVSDRREAQLVAFETVSTTRHLLASSLSKPILGPAERQPAVAGSFYPSDAALMNAELDRMFAPGPITAEEGFFGSNRPQPEPLHGAHVPPGCDPSGGIRFGSSKKKRRFSHPGAYYSAALAPHAGWVYSGRLAAQTLGRIHFPDTAIIFAPKHRPGGPDWAVAPHKSWVLPGQNVESDVVLARGIVEAVDLMQLDAVAHAQEHAIEVQLPIIAQLSPSTKVVGIVMHGGMWEVLQEGAIQLAEFLRQLPQMPLLIISSDMNHYASEEATRSVDRLALDAIESLIPETLLETVADNRISMCGAFPAAFVLETLRQLDLLHECIPVGYTTSAEASGDRSRVVGYAGLLFR